MAPDAARPPKKRRKKASSAGGGGHTGLQWLLGGGVSVDDFRGLHFEREPLHVRRPEGAEYYSDFSDIATPEALFALLDSGTVPVFRQRLSAAQHQMPHAPIALPRQPRSHAAAAAHEASPVCRRCLGRRHAARRDHLVQPGRSVRFVTTSCACLSDIRLKPTTNVAPCAIPSGCASYEPQSAPMQSGIDCALATSLATGSSWWGGRAISFAPRGGGARRCVGSPLGRALHGPIAARALRRGRLDVQDRYGVRFVCTGPQRPHASSRWRGSKSYADATPSCGCARRSGAQ